MGSHEACHEASGTKGHACDKEGSHEAPCHEGCGTSGTKGHACDEEGSHEARYEGSSTKGHAGDEEGSDEAPRHEGSSANQGHEGHEEVNFVPRSSRRHQRP